MSLLQTAQNSWQNKEKDKKSQILRSAPAELITLKNDLSGGESGQVKGGPAIMVELTRLVVML